MKQLEEKFLNEIKPLVNQFIGMSKQKLDIKQRMECVDIRKEVQNKIAKFKITYKDMLSKEIKEKETENIQINMQRAERVKKLIHIKANMLSRGEAIKQSKDEAKDDIYQLLCITQKEEAEKFNKIKQECNEEQELYKSNIEQIEELKKAQKEFDERYGDMNYITEIEMYRLDSFIGLKEESKTVRMSKSQVYDENGNVLSTDKVMDMQEEVDEERKSEFEEIQKQIAKQVLDEKKEEYNKYLEQKMKELEESIDEELQEMQQSKIKEDDENEKNNKGYSKKGKISLWQRVKSIFRKRNVPFLGEGEEKEQEEKPKDKFVNLKIGVPTPKQQNEKVKSILNHREKGDEKENEGFDEVLTLLD